MRLLKHTLRISDPGKPVSVSVNHLFWLLTEARNNSSVEGITLRVDYEGFAQLSGLLNLPLTPREPPRAPQSLTPDEVNNSDGIDSLEQTVGGMGALESRRALEGDAEARGAPNVHPRAEFRSWQAETLAEGTLSFEGPAGLSSNKVVTPPSAEHLGLQCITYQDPQGRLLPQVLEAVREAHGLLARQPSPGEFREEDQRLLRSAENDQLGVRLLAERNRPYSPERQAAVFSPPSGLDSGAPPTGPSRSRRSIPINPEVTGSDNARSPDRFISSDGLWREANDWAASIFEPAPGDLLPLWGWRCVQMQD